LPSKFGGELVVENPDTGASGTPPASRRLLVADPVPDPSARLPELGIPRYDVPEPCEPGQQPEFTPNASFTGSPTSKRLTDV